MLFGQVAEVDISGLFTLALGIDSLMTSFGLLKGKSWAWLLGVIIATISVISAISLLATSGFWWHVVLLIIYGVILYYMFKPNIKSYLGRAKISK